VSLAVSDGMRLDQTRATMDGNVAENQLTVVKNST